MKLYSTLKQMKMMKRCNRSMKVSSPVVKKLAGYKVNMAEIHSKSLPLLSNVTLDMSSFNSSKTSHLSNTTSLTPELQKMTSSFDTTNLSCLDESDLSFNTSTDANLSVSFNTTADLDATPIVMNRSVSHFKSPSIRSTSHFKGHSFTTNLSSLDESSASDLKLNSSTTVDLDATPMVPNRSVSRLKSPSSRSISHLSPYTLRFQSPSTPINNSRLFSRFNNSARSTTDLNTTPSDCTTPVRTIPHRRVSLEHTLRNRTKDKLRIIRKSTRGTKGKSKRKASSLNKMMLSPVHEVDNRGRCSEECVLCVFGKPEIRRQHLTKIVMPDFSNRDQRGDV